MRVTYEPESEKYWEELFQEGHGFVGIPYQRGSGLGSIFRSIFRFILPTVKSLGKKAVKTVGKQALVTGAKIAADLAEGRNFQESVKKHGRSAASNILSDAATEFQTGSGLGSRPEGHIKTMERPESKKRKKDIKSDKPSSLPFATIYD